MEMLIAILYSTPRNVSFLLSLYTKMINPKIEHPLPCLNLLLPCCISCAPVGSSSSPRGSYSPVTHSLTNTTPVRQPSSPFPPAEL